MPERVSRLLLGCVLFAVALRCVIGTDPFPYASADVFMTSSPPLSLTPKWSFALDGFVLLASAALLITQVAMKRWALWWQCVAVCIAGVALLAHINPRATDAMDNAVLGINWLTSFAACIAAWPLLRADARARAMVVATLVALAFAAALRGVYQVYVEHAQTMATFRATKDSYFASQGWSPDSAMARAFTRRISQPEATGWFGMANVAATVFASCGALLFGLSLHVWRARTTRDAATTWQLIAILVGVVACAAGVVMAGSKGGFAALGLGVALVLAVMVVASRSRAVGTALPRVSQWAGPAVIGLVLLAVLVRGLIGERLGELSLLFRSMYMHAALRIMGEHPLLGTGPAGFKDAYLLAKNPLNPEEIALPHSVLLDLLATLGVGGLALASVWVFFAWRAGRGLLPREQDPTTLATQDLGKPIFFILALAAIAAGYLERAAPLIDLIGLRIVALALGGVVGVAAALVMLRAPRAGAVALAGGACAFIAQAQIELTGTQPGAMLWGLLLLCVAGSMSPDVAIRAPRAAIWTRVRPWMPTPKHAVLLLVACCSVYLLGCGFWWRKARGWESSLRRASDAAEVVREFSQRRNALATRQPAAIAPTDSIDVLRQDLATHLKRAVPATPEGIDRALDDARVQAIPAVASALDRAARSNGSHLGTVRALVTVQMMHLAKQLETGSVTRDQLDAPMLTMRQFGEALASKTTYWSWLGTMYAERGVRSEETRDADLHAAIDNWQRANDLAPHNTLHAVKIADMYAQLGEREQAKRWSAVALMQHENLRLDPLAQLTDAELTRLRARVSEK